MWAMDDVMLELGVNLQACTLSWLCAEVGKLTIPENVLGLLALPCGGGPCAICKMYTIVLNNPIAPWSLPLVDTHTPPYPLLTHFALATRSWAANTITVGSTLSPTAINVAFAVGDIITVSGSANSANNIKVTVVAVTATVLTTAETLSTSPSSTEGNTIVLRKYDSMAILSLSSFAPPIALNNRPRWCLVADQRPVRWSSPDVSTSAQSRVEYSPSAVNKRGVKGAGTASITIDTDLPAFNVQVASSSNAVFTFSGATTPSFTSLFGSGAVKMTLLISGIGMATGNTGVCVTSAISNTVITCGTSFTPDSGSVVVHGASGKGKVTISTYHGGLIDADAVPIGSRLRVKRSDGDYETRSVDKTFGTQLDITAISVTDAFTDSPSAMLHVNTEAWVDESGTTEQLQCSRRGVCNENTGLCECFAGFRGNRCDTIDALHM